MPRISAQLAAAVAAGANREHALLQELREEQAAAAALRTRLEVEGGEGGVEERAEAGGVHEAGAAGYPAASTSIDLAAAIERKQRGLEAQNEVGLSIHCVHAHRTSAACALHAHRTSAACALHAQRMRSACAPHAH